MKVKMLEVVQGAGISGHLIHDDIDVTILNVGDEVEVDETLGAWLLEHRKAEVYDPKAKKPEAKAVPTPTHDPEAVTSELKEEDGSIMTTKNISTSGKKRGAK